MLKHRSLYLPAVVAALLMTFVAVRPAAADGAEPAKLEEMLETLILKSSPLEPMEGFASYYAKRFEGRRTTSGHRYHPDKLTAAHESLPLGTVVRVVNPVTSQEVHVTITDRCARKAFNFIDLSRAAAKKIGLWGKGKIRVVIIPLLQEKLEKPT
jgi:rare lipoprotein A